VAKYSRIDQHRRRQAVVVAEFGDVDAALAEAVQAQLADAPGRAEIARRGEVAMHFEQAEDQIGMGPDVPGAQARRAVPAHRLGRLLAHEAALGRVGAEVAVVFLG
jgi:hypothetical protein